MASSGTLRRSARLVRSWIGALRGPAERRGPVARTEAEMGEVSARGVARRDIEALVGMPVGDLNLYEHALRHRSLFRGLPTDGTESNERLEFLGDAVLGAVVAERMYRAFPDRSEGLLTRTRALLVNGKALAGFAEMIGLAPLVLMSDNMEGSDGRSNQTILADAFEAVVGAVYLDLGFAAARRFVNRVLDECVDLREAAADRSNYKSLLLEHVQALGMEQPSYRVLAEEGPSHDRRFTVAAVVDGVALGEGRDRSKKSAEQSAAQQALTVLRERAEAEAAANSDDPEPEKTLGREL
ncbi:MAG: ribonuclease III [Bacteroidota bacterium]